VADIGGSEEALDARVESSGDEAVVDVASLLRRLMAGAVAVPLVKSHSGSFAAARRFTPLCSRFRSRTVTAAEAPVPDDEDDEEVEELLALLPTAFCLLEDDASCEAVCSGGVCM